MEIGGVDIIIPTKLGKAAIGRALAALSRRWPDAVFECADGGGVRFASATDRPEDAYEVFVYRDHAAEERWNADDPANPAAVNSMIYLIADDDELTLVADERDAETRAMTAAIELELEST